MLRQELWLNITQKQTLALTPRLLQAIRVLGMTRQELSDYVEDELEGNPALEASWDEEREAEPTDAVEGEEARERADPRAEDFDWAEYLNEKGYDDISYSRAASSDGVPDRADAGATLYDYLIEQISEKDLERVSDDASRAYNILSAVIESLDEKGFLTQSAAEIAAQLCACESEIQEAVSVLQGFDPAGVAAPDLRASLALQYLRNGGDDPLVTLIIENHLQDVASRSASAVAKNMGKKRSDVERAFEIISALSPNPGAGFADGNATVFIVPDIIMEKTADGFEPKVNSAGVPSLTVSPYCRKILSETEKGSEAYEFLTERLNAAVALIKSLEQREQTMYNISTAVLRRQRVFLEEGEAFLTPMTLKQIAEEVGVHESTVSRAVRGKYVQTPRGVVELKKLFGAGVKTADGSGARSETVKARIAELVGGEDKRSPLSDREIAESLENSGLCVSRRTVAKDREETGIPSAAKRARRQKKEV